MRYAAIAVITLLMVAAALRQADSMDLNRALMPAPVAQTQNFQDNLSRVAQAYAELHHLAPDSQRKFVSYTD
jgi:hypothetical protein